MDKWEAKHQQLLRRYDRRIRAIYESAVREAAAIGATVTSYNPDRPFTFKDYPNTRQRADKLISDLANDMQVTIVNGVDAEWTLANDKNNELCNVVFGDNAKMLSAEQARRYYGSNDKALEAFKSRRASGLLLSDRVWNYTNQFKQEIEMGIDLGLRSGTPAVEMAKELKQYLKYPDKLFRRVRDEYGQLHLSKAAAAFHPGQGVYRSSFKNALRLTRTENNIAYRTSDYTRWQQLDFVVGIEIHLSNNHPIDDICNELAGKYPKDFKFTGWHPQCRCYVTSILKTPEEMSRDNERIMRGEPISVGGDNMVTGVPPALRKWTKDNAERIGRAKQRPYFMRDNKKYFPQTPFKIAAQRHATRTPEQASEIRRRWIRHNADIRHAARTNDEIQAIKATWNERRAIDNYARRILNYMNGISDVDTSKLAALMNRSDRIAVLAEARSLKTIGKDILGLKYIDNPMEVARKFSAADVKVINDAVGTKLSSWQSLTAAKRIEKINFEINWVEENKKYSTWKVAQDAYRKELIRLETSVQLQDIESKLTVLKEFHTQSKVYNALIADIDAKYSKIFNAIVANKPIHGNVSVEEINKILKQAEERKKNIIKNRVPPNSSNAFTKERKDAALWAKSPEAADKMVRSACENTWQNISQKHRDALYLYTHNYSPINEPLRGIPYAGTATQRVAGRKAIPLITEAIDMSYYNFDMWLQRGEFIDGFLGKFGIDLEAMTELQAQSLIGRDGIEKAFMSCANSKGSGFSGTVIYNIYAPRGTKMMYLEPFSEYGLGTGSALWDGISSQSDFGSEAEMLLQRGTRLRITKIEKTAGQWYVDVDVIGSDIAEFIP